MLEQRYRRTGAFSDILLTYRTNFSKVTVFLLYFLYLLLSIQLYWYLHLVWEDRHG